MALVLPKMNREIDKTPFLEKQKRLHKASDTINHLNFEIRNIDTILASQDTLAKNAVYLWRVD